MPYVMRCADLGTESVAGERRLGHERPAGTQGVGRGAPPQVWRARFDGYAACMADDPSLGTGPSSKMSAPEVKASSAGTRPFELKVQPPE